MSTDKTQRCGICGVPCCALAVNNTFLCDGHFDAWLALPRDLTIGGHVAMADFVVRAKAAR